MKERLPAQMVRVDRHAVVLRVDAWEEWHGHYLWDCKVGVIAFWVYSIEGELKRFKRFAFWADSIEGGTAHTAQTSAIAFRKS